MSSNEEILKLLHNMDGKLNTVQTDVSGLKEDVIGLKKDVGHLKEDVAGLKEDVAGLKEDVTVLKEDVGHLKEGQDRLEKQVNAITLQTADLMEFRTEVLEELKDIRADVNIVEQITAKNWRDIAGLKA